MVLCSFYGKNSMVVWWSYYYIGSVAKKHKIIIKQAKMCVECFYVTQNIWLINLISSDMVIVFACFFRIIFIASIPWIVEQVDLTCLNPSMLLVILLMLLWSFSMMLFRYLEERYFVFESSFPFSIAFLIVFIVAAYLSVVITLGFELYSKLGL